MTLGGIAAIILAAMSELDDDLVIRGEIDNSSVPELLRYYVDRLVDEERLPFRRFGVAAQNRLRNYPWPGNIRELKNLVHRLLIQGGSEEIQLDEIERQIAARTVADEPLVKQDLLLRENGRYLVVDSLFREWVARKTY